MSRQPNKLNPDIKKSRKAQENQTLNEQPPGRSSIQRNHASPDTTALVFMTLLVFGSLLMIAAANEANAQDPEENIRSSQDLENDTAITDENVSQQFGVATKPPSALLTTLPMPTPPIASKTSPSSSVTPKLSSTASTLFKPSVSPSPTKPMNKIVLRKKIETKITVNKSLRDFYKKNPHALDNHKSLLVSAMTELYENRYERQKIECLLEGNNFEIMLVQGKSSDRYQFHGAYSSLQQTILFPMEWLKEGTIYPLTQILSHELRHMMDSYHNVLMGQWMIGDNAASALITSDTGSKKNSNGSIKPYPNLATNQQSQLRLQQDLDLYRSILNDYKGIKELYDLLTTPERSLSADKKKRANSFVDLIKKINNKKNLFTFQEVIPEADYTNMRDLLKDAPTGAFVHHEIKIPYTPNWYDQILGEPYSKPDPTTYCAAVLKVSKRDAHTFVATYVYLPPDSSINVGSSIEEFFTKNPKWFAQHLLTHFIERGFSARQIYYTAPLPQLIAEFAAHSEQLITDDDRLYKLLFPNLLKIYQNRAAEADKTLHASSAPRVTVS